MLRPVCQVALQPGIDSLTIMPCAFAHSVSPPWSTAKTSQRQTALPFAMVDDAGAGKDAEGLRSAYLPSEIEHVAVRHVAVCRVAVRHVAVRLPGGAE